MEDYIITTEDTADLPSDYIASNHLHTMSLSCMMNGETYDETHPLPPAEFYRQVRAGAMPTTSQVNQEQARRLLCEFLKINKNIIHIAFSSGLSGTYANIYQVAQEIMQEQPDCRITVVDSLCASLGEGLLVHKALELQKQGKSYDEVVKWLEDHKLNLVHNFTVNDLFHLYRGGRVSRATAILGTMINIKPVLHVDNEGHLINVGKVRGRRKSIVALVDAMEKQIGSWKDKNDVIFISHGDCLEDALTLKEMIKERLGFQNFLINYVGTTIGSHSGPGTLALFYMGDVR